MTIFIILCSALKADSSIILHFYNEPNEHEKNSEHGKVNIRSFSKFIKKKHKCFEHTECKECVKYIIEDRNKIHLNFDMKSSEKKRASIFISTNVLKYQDFIYFLKVSNEIQDIKENLRFSDFSMLIHILDIFKFKKDKNFSSLIRVFLLSIIYNNQNDYEEDLIKIITTSSSVFKIILYEFCSIYLLVLDSDFRGISTTSFKKQINENFDDVICSDKKFLEINMEIFNKISKLIRRSQKFEHIFKIIFGSIKPLRVSLYYCELHDDIANILAPSFLISCEALCFENWENMKFIEKIFESLILKNLKTLFFLNCEFSFFKESLLKKFTADSRIYILNSSLETTLDFRKPVYSKESIEFLKRLVLKLYNEIRSKKNTSIFLEKNTGKPYKIEKFNINKYIETNRSVGFQEAFNFKDHNIYFKDFFSICENFVTIDFAVINIQKIGKICIRLRDIFTNGLNFKSTDISENIVELYIYASKLTDNFLRDILTLPRLKTICISDCTLVFQKHKSKYAKNLSIDNLSITACDFENQNGVFEFINSMPNIKTFDFHSFKNASFYIDIFKNCRIELNSLENFHYGEKNKFSASYLKFLSKDSITTLQLVVNSKIGSLKELFFEKKLRNVTRFVIYHFKIGTKDKKAMVNCTNMNFFTLYKCEFDKISFFELFDVKKEYAFRNIYLDHIVLKSQDVYFLSNLKQLRWLSLNPRFADNTAFIRFFCVNSFKPKLTLRCNQENLPGACVYYLKEIFGDK
ncbi:hypothetical protein CWI36_0206p0040 [Hamiltosporidium magnivora]|uniref:Uncharacterized protein n=1 Tax=Hamiltosporidium magnivora TaxID=148818 RepID=A0A4Q9LJA0_9MICR|nr:hypothetical protein CWI36_0206p0040 [Hamiltosporidium magnivora]